MQPQTLDNVKSAIPGILERVPYLKLMILFGSRARGDHDAASDWDIAVLYDEDQRKEYEKGGWDWLRGWSILQKELELPDDGIDVVDLGSCSNILAHAIARDSKLIYERELGEFEQFRQRALMSKAELKAFCEEQRAFIKEGLKRFKK
jgi:predicted nucleotidyltransferase